MQQYHDSNTLGATNAIVCHTKWKIDYYVNNQYGVAELKY